MRKNNTYIDIFAGCGGISLGLHKSGWKGIFAIEKDSMAFETLEHNLIDKKKHFKWPIWLPKKEHDIKKIIKNYKNNLIKLRGKVTLVVGGPPCQGFSMAGRRKINDKRNKLVDSYIEFIKLVKPSMIFFENVKGFTMGFKKKNKITKPYSSIVEKKLKKLGYNIDHKLVDFSDFGVPQRRKRFIIIGTLKGIKNNFFKNLYENKSKFLKKKGLVKKTTVKKAISDLEKTHGIKKSTMYTRFADGIYSKSTNKYQKILRRGFQKSYPDSHRFSNHNKETIHKFNFILTNLQKNKNIAQEIKKKFNLKKRFIVALDANNTSPTLTTLPDDYIHYSEPRILTVREYARLQTFDDWFEFKGNYTTGGKLRTKETPRYTQVGNAVPPLFMEHAGNILKEIIND